MDSPNILLQLNLLLLQKKNPKMSVKEFPGVWSGIWSSLFPLWDVSKTNHLTENSNNQNEESCPQTNCLQGPWEQHCWRTIASMCQRQQITWSRQGQQVWFAAEMNQPYFPNTAHTVHTSGRSNLIFLISFGNRQNTFGQNLFFPLQNCRLGWIK